MSQKVKREDYSTELWKAYFSKIKQLYDFCKKFDDGEIYYGRDIANILFLMCSEYNQKSLLSQTNIKSKIRFLSTVVTNFKLSKPILSGSSMVSIHQTINENGVSKTELKANTSFFVDGTTNLSFSEWWSQCIVFKVSCNNLVFSEMPDPKKFFKRSDIITLIRHQDGGAHFDENLDLKFSQLKQNFLRAFSDAGGVTFILGEESLNQDLNKKIRDCKDFDDYPLYLARVMALEFLESIKNSENSVVVVNPLPTTQAYNL